MIRVAAALLLLLATACSSAPPPPLHDLAPGDIATLRAAVNAHPERTRLVVLLSPT